MTSEGRQHLGVEYFVKALSTGERTAAQRLEPFLADDVEYDSNTQPGASPKGREVFVGRQAVLDRVFGFWPATPGYKRLGWSDPFSDGDDLKVITSGAVTLTFTFNGQAQIHRVRLDGGFGSGVSAVPEASGTVEQIPLVIKGILNNALANETPVVVTYVDENGAPHSSWNGSVCVLSPTQIAVWIRNPKSTLPIAIGDNPFLSLFYRDSRALTTITAEGRASISTDENTTRRSFELLSEVQQNHDPHRRGVAVIVDVMYLEGSLGAGRGDYILHRD